MLLWWQVKLPKCIPLKERAQKGMVRKCPEQMVSNSISDIIMQEDFHSNMNKIWPTYYYEFKIQPSFVLNAFLQCVHDRVLETIPSAKLGFYFINFWLERGFTVIFINHLSSFCPACATKFIIIVRFELDLAYYSPTELVDYIAGMTQNGENNKTTCLKYSFRLWPTWSYGSGPYANPLP